MRPTHLPGPRLTWPALFGLGLLAGSPGAQLRAEEPDGVAPLWRLELGEPALGLEALGGQAFVSLYSELIAASDGEVRWRSPAERSAITAGAVVVANGDALDGLDPTTGGQLWRRSLPAGITSLAACPGHRLVAATHPGSLNGTGGLIAHAVDPLTGESLWASAAPGPLVGAGGGFLFAAQPSRFEGLRDALVAIRCADGAVTDLRAPPPDDRPSPDFIELLGAGGGLAVTLRSDMTRRDQAICAAPLEAAGPAPRCVPVREVLAAAGLERGGAWVNGAALREGSLYFSLADASTRSLAQEDRAQALAWDLHAGGLAAQSPAGQSEGPILDLGGALLTVAGRGVDGRAALLDPVTLAPIWGAELGAPPGPFAADGDVAWVATDDGALRAWRLPFAARPREAEAPVAPAAVALDGRTAALGSRLEIDATAALPWGPDASTPGAIGALAWVGPGRLAVGGDDDRVRVFDAEGGAAVYTSGALGGGVQRIAACDDGRFAAQLDGGPITMHAPNKEGWRYALTIPHSGGGALGTTGPCSRLITAGQDGQLVIYDPGDGRAVAEFQTEAGVDLQSVGVGADQVALPWGRGLKVIALGGMVPRVLATLPSLPVSESGPLVQALPTGEADLLLEYCGEGSCEVIRVRYDGRTLWRHALPIAGSNLALIEPSSTALSPDGRWLYWHRDGLEALVLEVGSGARYSLGAPAPAERLRSAGAFAPDSRALAVSRLPGPGQVAIYALPE